MSEKIRDLLENLITPMVGELKDKPNRVPTHGTCCTCQTCGYNHDDCICLIREWIKVLDQATSLIRQLMLECVGEDDYKVLLEENSYGVGRVDGYNDAKKEIRKRVEEL
jgi:hypothetical protein